MKEVKKNRAESAKIFSIHIETIASEKNISCLDAILEYCKTNYLDPEEVKSLITTSLKEKLKNNFIEMNYIKKTGMFEI